MNKILTWKGRINRLQYLLVSVIIYIVTFLIVLILVKQYSVDQTSIYQLPVFIVLLLLNLYLVICNTIKRLNDIGLNKLFTLIVFVPYVNMGFWIYLLVKKGKVLNHF